MLISYVHGILCTEEVQHLLHSQKTALTALLPGKTTHFLQECYLSVSHAGIHWASISAHLYLPIFQLPLLCWKSIYFHLSLWARHCPKHLVMWTMEPWIARNYRAWFKVILDVGRSVSWAFHFWQQWLLVSKMSCATKPFYFAGLFLPCISSPD